MKKFKELLKNRKVLSDSEVQELRNKAKEYKAKGNKYLEFKELC
jgi:hypothetical protein